MNDRVGTAALPAGNATLSQRPEPPRPEDCCGSGCVHCIYVIYDEALLKWGREVEKLVVPPQAGTQRRSS